VINRFDLDESMTGKIEQWCREEGITVLGKVPFDPEVIEAIRNLRAITQTDTFPAAKAVQILAAELLPLLMEV
jgi:MinD superfamily P-loop ATPase